MNEEADLGTLLEEFSNRVAHPKGRGIGVLEEASVTVAQVILLGLAARGAAATPSGLAQAMCISQPSASQMIDRLVRQGMLSRTEDPGDRRRKAIAATPKALDLLGRLRQARREDFAEGVEELSSDTRALLAAALRMALEELA